MSEKKTVTMVLKSKVQIFGSDENHQLHTYGPGVVEVLPEHADHPYMKAHGAEKYNPRAEAEKAAKAAEDAKRKAELADAEAELAEANRAAEIAEKAGDEVSVKKAKTAVEKATAKVEKLRG